MIKISSADKNTEPDLWGKLGLIYHRFDGPYDFIETQMQSNIIRDKINVEQLLNGKIVRKYTADTDHTGKIQFHRNITDDPIGIFEFRLLTTSNLLLDRKCYSWNGFDNPKNGPVDCNSPIPTEIIKLKEFSVGAIISRKEQIRKNPKKFLLGLALFFGSILINQIDSELSFPLTIILASYGLAVMPITERKFS